MNTASSVAAGARHEPRQRFELPSTVFPTPLASPLPCDGMVHGFGTVVELVVPAFDFHGYRMGGVDELVEEFPAFVAHVAMFARLRREVVEYEEAEYAAT